MARGSTAGNTELERLIRINGAGRWTVEMLFIFNLGGPDALPVINFPGSTATEAV